ncbi:keratin-associated protein 5-3 isoform X2 [Diabrotica virgifera virgifera]|uniref:Keratin-associated protein 5-3-like isoform X2 n=1 Tax=Diabrotica virgifera virgifera TaxID=50390 RepID=A0A6P7FF54_DIAVI|nr:keratin-associated protein 5-3 isoform X2 [Diabrotica virgifera virgifera]
MISSKVLVAAILVVFVVSVQCTKFRGGCCPGECGRCGDCSECDCYDRCGCDNYRGGGYFGRGHCGRGHCGGGHCGGGHCCPIPIVLSPTVGLLTKMKAKFLSKFHDFDDCGCGYGGGYGPWMHGKFGKFGGGCGCC